MKYLALLLCIPLWGCPKTITVTRPDNVNVAVPVSCINEALKEEAQMPDFKSDAELLMGPSYQVPLKLWDDHLDRIDYIERLRAIITACEA